MIRLRINLNNDHSVGLGDNLCMLSALANARDPIDLYVNNDHKTYDRLTQYKKIFRIPDSSLQIYLAEGRGDFNNVGWPVKLFSEYYRPLFVNVNGQLIPTTPPDDKRKKFIAIAGSTIPDNDGDNKWPGCRSRPQEYWNKIYGWIKSIGYEAVSVDDAFTNLEDKIEILTKHCCAIVSYEGGMAHLAHMLKLPCLLVDWKLPSPSTELKDFHCEFVHRTNSVYILRTDDEILNWHEGIFNRVIDGLRNGKTNNRLVNGECKLSFEGPNIQGRVSVRDKSNTILLSANGLYGDNKVAEFLNMYQPKKN